MTQTLHGDQVSNSTESEVADHDFKLQDTRLIARFRRAVRRRSRRLRTDLSQLTFSQWMYLLAFFSLFFTADSEGEALDTFMLAGIIAGVGLMRELWHLFMRIWAHTAGKGLLFVLYAATANFALAISALKINSISGVEPTVFIFTMGFATLLMLPFWLILASMLFLGTALVVGNFWLLIALLLRIVKIRLPIHWEDQSFAVLTLILRIILIPALIWALALMLNPYLKQMDMFNEPLGFHVVRTNEISQEQAEQIRNLPRDEIAAALAEAKAEFQQQQDSTPSSTQPSTTSSTKDKTLQELIDDPSLSPQQKAAFQTLEALSVTKQEDDPTTAPKKPEEPAAPGLKWLDLMIAQFIYRFETYPYSACAKEPNQRVLTINENLVFVAERDSDYETGIKFSAMECIPRNSVHEKGLKSATTEESGVITPPAVEQETSSTATNDEGGETQ